MKVICPHCEKSTEIKREHYGVKAECPHCGLPFMIPVPPGILPGVHPPYRPQELQEIASLIAWKVLVHFIWCWIISALILIAIWGVFRR